MQAFKRPLRRSPRRVRWLTGCFSLLATLCLCGIATVALAPKPEPQIKITVPVAVVDDRLVVLTSTRIPTPIPTQSPFSAPAASAPALPAAPAETTETPDDALPLPTPDPPARVTLPDAIRVAVVDGKDYVNVRTGPGTDFAVLGQLSAGVQAGVTGRNAEGTWWRIAFDPGTGREQDGWVFGELVVLIGDRAQVAVVSMPTPGTTMQIPSARPTSSAPCAPVRVGAICRDGTRSQATGRGACSRHGGVSQWLVSTCP